MKKISLNEIMGSSGESAKQGLCMDDLPELLGEKMPDIKPNPVGRVRLITALKNRFGNGWRAIPGVRDLMKDFDEQAKFEIKLAEMRMIRAKKKES